MSYPLKHIYENIVVTGQYATGTTTIDSLGNTRSVKQTVYLRITYKIDSPMQYFRQLTGKTDPRLPYLCYIVHSWVVNTDGTHTIYPVDVDKLDDLLKWDVGTFSIINRGQNSTRIVRKMFGQKFVALLDGTLPLPVQ